MFDDYVTELRQRITKREFDNLLDCLIKDFSIIGLKDLRLTERLLKEHDILLKKAIQACQTIEEAKRQLASLQKWTFC